MPHPQYSGKKDQNSIKVNKSATPFFTFTAYVSHHTQTSKWTKLLTLKITIFGLKMMVKSGLERIILKFHSPFRVAAAQCKKICPEWLNWPGWLAGIF